MEEDQTRKLLRLSAFLIAFFGIIPVGYFVIGSLIIEIPHFFDTCYYWGDQPPIRPDKRCPRVSRTSETMLGATTRLVLVQGGALVGAMLGLVGIYRSSMLLSAVGILMLFLMAAPLSLGRFGMYFLFSGSVLLMASLMAKKVAHTFQK